MTRSIPRPIMIMAGGTGGHIFPALAVAKRLRDQNIPLLWLGTEKGLESRIVPEAGFTLLTLSIGGLRGKGVITKCLAPFKLLHAVTQAIGLFVHHKPAAVLGMGGFASGPGGLAAWVLRKPLVIHEQNAIAGMTNRLLSKLATVVFEAFPNTFPRGTEAQAVGNPVREEIERVQATPHDGINILIVGGSLGAAKLNHVVPKTLAKLRMTTDQAIAIWHQTGQREHTQTQADYAEQNLNARVDAFIEEMSEAYAWADLVICRSGALTVSELAAAGKPSILVPYPHAVDDHQTANAQYLVGADAGSVIADHDLNETRLLAILEPWITSPERLRKIASNAKTQAMHGATERVADCLKELAYG